MRYVGYVAASTLEDIKQQWGDLWEGEVNYILFDRECLRGFDRGNNEDHPEKKEISDYIEVMRAGQQINLSARQASSPDDPNDICYEFIEDLQPGDRLVLTSLNVLPNARQDIWDKIMELNVKEIYLIVLSDGFSSAGEYGDTMIKMMNELYQLGILNGKRHQW